MRISTLLAAAVSFGLSVAAGNAASITILSPGNLGPTSGATFNSITATTYSQTTPSGPFSDGGANFSGSGVVMNNGGQPSLGLYATPFGDTTNYMAVLGGGSEKIAFSSLKNSLRPLLGFGRHVQLAGVLQREHLRGDDQRYRRPAAYAREWRPDGLCLERLRRDWGAAFLR